MALTSRPPIIYRTQRKNLFKGRVKKTEYNLLQGVNPVTVTCQYDERNVVTALISGKRKEIRKGKKLNDRSQYPLSIVLAESKLKIHMNLGVNSDMFVLQIN